MMMLEAADEAADARQHHKAANNAGQELVALVQVSSSCDENLLQGRLKSFGVAWCNSLDSNGRYLVRFLTHDGLEAAVKALHGSSWLGQPFSVEPLSVGQLQPAGQESCLTPRADSIPTMQLTEDYFSAMLQDEQQQQAEQEQQARSAQQSKAASAFEVSALQDLEPCDAEWIPTAAADSSILGPLEDDPLSNDASPLQSFTSNTSTCQLWSQRSIGAVARKDLAKFAAMQHMAQQHSCNSPTQASLLAAGHHVLGLGSTWSSAHSVHSSSSLASLALTAAGGSSIFQDGVRRSSSPSGQLQGQSSLPCAPTATTPRSPFHAAGDAGGFGSGPQQPQQQLNLTRSGSAGQTSSLTLNLPLELGLGDSASALADEEVMRVHNMAAARQQQQQQGASGAAAGQSRPLTIRTGPQHGSGLASSLPNFAGLLSSYGSEGASSPLAGQPLSTEGSGGFLAAGASGAAGGSSRFAGGASGSFGSGNGMGAEAGAGYPGSPHGLGLVPPPPPPPPQGQPGTPGTPPGGLLGQQPPPPPPPPPGGSRTPPPPALDSYSGSPYEGAGRTGAISPVQPAPPPRAITPGATWQGPGSGNCSPRVGGLSQPQSPSNGYRGPPRAAGLRGFQHGMSNLGQHSGSYDGYGSQPPPYGRVGSPVMGPRAHSPCGVPPPPPPSTQIPPGYVAAATAAATACGLHVSPAPSPPPPAGLGPRSGSTCGPSGAPVSNLSTPTGRAAAGTAATGSTSASASGSASAGVNAADAGDAQQGATKVQQDTAAGSERTTNSRKQQQQQQLTADGVLFVEELLQLLKQPGATAGNPFLANLTDLLDCTLSTSSAAAAGAAAEGNGKGSSGSSRSTSGHSSGSNSRRASSDEQKSAAAAAAAAAAAVLAANGSAKVPLLPMAAITESLNKSAGANSSNNTPRTARGSNGGSRESSKGGGRRGAQGSGKQVPVDAAAFLGMLQEAAAPLLAAAAAAAATQRFSNAGMAGQGRRPGQQRGSSGGYEEACGSISSRGQSQGGDARGSKAGGLRGSTVGPGAGSNSSSNAQPGVSEAGASAAEGALGNSGGLSDLSTLPLNLLLRHSLAGGLSKGGSGPQGSQMLFPLHPRTTTHSSCGGGTAPGTPLGTPMLLVPQTVPELLSTRAALIRLLLSAHAFVHGPVYSRMASRLCGIEELYDSMHEDPVVVKRRKCRDMAAMRDVIKRDTAFSQAVSQVSSMRNHIYSLSRKVLIGFGHMESLPIDLLLGGLTTELAAILAEPCDPQQLGQTPASGAGGSSSGTAQATPRESRTSNASSAEAAAAAAGGSSSDGSAAPAAAAAAAAADTGGIVLPQHVAGFFTTALPVPKLALLVFVEFVPVDPSPCSTSLPPSGLGAPDAWTPSVNGGSSGSNGSGSVSHGGGRGSQQHTGVHSSRDHRRSSNEHADSHSHCGSYHSGNGNGTPRNRSGHHGRWGHGRDRDTGHSNGGGGRMRDSHGGGSNPNTPRRGSRGGSYSNGGASNGGGGNGQQDGGKRNSSRRSGHGGFDLVAEAAALEAAASAAAPLVAAAVCDLPPGNRRQGSNAGSSS